MDLQIFEYQKVSPSKGLGRIALDQNFLSSVKDLQGNQYDELPIFESPGMPVYSQPWQSGRVRNRPIIENIIEPVYSQPWQPDPAPQKPIIREKEPIKPRVPIPKPEEQQSIDAKPDFPVVNPVKNPEINSGITSNFEVSQSENQTNTSGPLETTTFLKRKYKVAGVELNTMQLGGSILLASVLGYGIYNRIKS